MSKRFALGHACVIGVGGDLPNTVSDAIALANILKDPERCAYPPEQVHTLTQQQARRADILETLDQLAQATTTDSMVIIYFSGHGYQVATAMGEAYYLMPFGYEPSKLYKTAISGLELTAKLRAIPAKKLLLLLDCCHVGGLGEAADLQYEVEKAPLPPEAQTLFAQGQGRVIIASSQANELSLAGRPYSAFTLALIEALAGQGASKLDGYVRVADLALYAREVVPRRTGDRQHPILNFDQADNFKLAYYAGGEAEPKALPFTAEPEIESEPGEFNRQVIQNTPVEAAGDRSVAIGGDAQGSILITGDGNTVGNHNTVQRVTQQGKYNLNFGAATGLQIGDTYHGSRSSGGSDKDTYKAQPERLKRSSPSTDSASQKEVFISYAWGGKSEEMANQIEQALAAEEISLIRDKNYLDFKGRIKAFMERIGRGKCVVLVISEKYLKSENCMFELLQIAKNEQFYERIFPVVLEDARIYKPIDRIQYVQYWEQEIQALDQQIRSVSSANLEGFREDIDLYNEIRQHLPRLTNILKDMNSLTAQIHSESGFAELIEAIQQKLEE
ncbi:caspase family protein [Almyronema epifaneia]|uniref:Caspase family protein n=1 Tax=Almyronema epifaneia S1 TaxID=2991925 RepID=A0ABW6IL21_9CYAN